MRGSETELIKGIEPIVQSQQRFEGQKRRPRLTKRRWVKVRAFGNGGAWLPGLSNLVNTGKEEPCSNKRATRRRAKEQMRLKTGRNEGRRRCKSSFGFGLLLGLSNNLIRVLWRSCSQQSSWTMQRPMTVTPCSLLSIARPAARPGRRRWR